MSCDALTATLFTFVSFEYFEYFVVPHELSGLAPCRSREVVSSQFLSSPPTQCRKWRRPVNSIAMPYSLQAAMTSSSRFDPPG